ncbi:MAG: alpha/beta hydrolase [Tabrizicola sp.]|nr:alpha/beta hydrolase [Tabrizicola sp.]
MRRIALLALVLLLVAVYGFYRRDLARLRTSLAEGSVLIETRHGPVEVAIRGEGAPVLLLHGAGGGYDQGLLLAQMFGGEGHQWIAVSRFGYLRSPLPDDASTRAQAEALVEVLDALKVGRVAVLAMSGGVPPALQLAANHPERVSGLALLSSAPFTPLTAEVQDLPMPAWAYQALFSSDFPIWALTHVAPDVLDPVFDLTPERRGRLTAAEAATTDAMILAFLPVTDRLAGLANEGAAIDPAARYDLALITAPTLIVHARDDGINPFPIAEHLAVGLPKARFLALPDGGHLLLGHREEVAKAVAPILRP